MFLWGNTELIVEGVMPDLLHVIPVGDNAVLDGVLQGEDTSLGLGLVSNIGVLLSHSNHDTLMTWASNNGGEHGTGSVISGETGFAHTGAVVNDESGNFLLIHGVERLFVFVELKISGCVWSVISGETG